MALERVDSPTLCEGIEGHLRAMRARRAAPRSLATLLEEQERNLGKWLERPLASLSRHEVATRHGDLTLSPVHPTLAVTFNRRRREPIPWDELPAWRAQPALGAPRPGARHAPSPPPPTTRACTPST